MPEQRDLERLLWSETDGPAGSWVDAADLVATGVTLWRLEPSMPMPSGPLATTLLLLLVPLSFHPAVSAGRLQDALASHPVVEAVVDASSAATSGNRICGNDRRGRSRSAKPVARS